MQISRARQPLIAASVSLLAFGGCVAAFMPPLNEQTLESVPLTILLGIGVAVTLILHLVFVGIAAHRLGRSVAWWVVVALVFFPIASIVGLILAEWFSDEESRPQGQRTA